MHLFLVCFLSNKYSVTVLGGFIFKHLGRTRTLQFTVLTHWKQKLGNQVNILLLPVRIKQLHGKIRIFISYLTNLLHKEYEKK